MNNSKEQFKLIERETIPFEKFYDYLEKYREENPGKSTGISMYRYISRFYTYKGWDHTAHIFQDSDFDTDYFLKQMQFLESLTEEERKVLASYTKYGDQLINGFLRKQWNNKTLFAFISSRMSGHREDETASWD